MIRPEKIRLQTGLQTSSAVPAGMKGTIQEVQFFGSFWRVSVQRAQGVNAPPHQGADLILVDVPVATRETAPVVGEAAHLDWDASAAHPIANLSDAPS